MTGAEPSGEIPSDLLDAAPFAPGGTVAEAGTNPSGLIPARGSLIALGLAWAGFMITAVGAQQVDLAPRGALLFENRCARCHGVKGDGDGGLGPSLIGVVGRPAASRPDFLYSSALKAKGGVWTPALLDVYIADPQAFAPGADMDVSSPDPAERAAIIEHIKTLK